MEEESEEMEEEVLEEGRIAKGQRIIVKPSKEEWENHMRTHIPYRKWCPHCVRGKRKAGAHSSVQDELKETEEVPVISFDYIHKRQSKEKKKILKYSQY